MTEVKPRPRAEHVAGASVNGALVTAQEDGRGEKGRHSQLPSLWHSPPTPPTQGDEQLLSTVLTHLSI